MGSDDHVAGHSEDDDKSDPSEESYKIPIKINKCLVVSIVAFLLVLILTIVLVATLSPCTSSAKLEANK